MIKVILENQGKYINQGSAVKHSNGSPRPGRREVNREGMVKCPETMASGESFPFPRAGVGQWTRVPAVPRAEGCLTRGVVFCTRYEGFEYDM